MDARLARAGAAQGGAARNRRGLHRARADAEQLAPAAVRAQLARHFDPTGYPHIDTFSITGPYNATGPGDTPSRRQVFLCRPATPAEEEPCARRIISTLVRRAYRGMDTQEDLQRLMGFYATGRKAGNFERGVQLALQRMLASAKFVLRIERDPAGAAPGSIYRISDLELASRLSFFLWSSIPDDRLIKVAAEGRLRQPEVLRQATRRMLADPKAQALVTNFAGQWLYLRNLKNMVPLSTTFVDFDDNLRRAFEQEAVALLPEHHPGGSQRPGPDDGRLHLRQRAAGTSTTASTTSTAATSAASR